MRPLLIVFKKEMLEIVRDRRTLIAIGLAALATPLIMTVISQLATKTATQTYTVGYSGEIPVGLDVLLRATGLKLERVPDPAAAARQQGHFVGGAFGMSAGRPVGLMSGHARETFVTLVEIQVGLLRCAPCLRRASTWSRWRFYFAPAMGRDSSSNRSLSCV